MPTLLPNDEVPRDRLQGYRVFIWAHDHPHPPHVHFGKRERVSGWNLGTGRCVDEDGFSASEVREQGKILAEYRGAIVRSWNAHWQRRRGGR